MWNVTQPVNPFTPYEQQQILVIASGVVLGATTVFILYNLVQLLNWIGTKLHNLIYSFISIIWTCIVLFFDLTLKIGRIATGLVLLSSIAAACWVYTNSPALFSNSPLLGWDTVALVLRSIR